MIRRLKPNCEPPSFEGYAKFDAHTAEFLGFEEAPGGPLRMWVNLRDGLPPNSRYGAGADISGGAGCTPSCLSIADARTGKKVLEFMDSNIEPKEFGTLSVALCSTFCDESGIGAKLCWEQSGPGGPYGAKIWKDHHYTNVYCRTSEMQFRQAVSDKPGLAPTRENFRMVHEDYRSALNMGYYLNSSERALDECLSFKYTSDGRGIEHSQYISSDDTGSRENHGDIAIADALSYKMIKGDVEKRNKPTEEEKAPTPGSSAWREWIDEQEESEQLVWA